MWNADYSVNGLLTYIDAMKRPAIVDHGQEWRTVFLLGRELQAFDRTMTRNGRLWPNDRPIRERMELWKHRQSISSKLQHLVTKATVETFPTP